MFFSLLLFTTTFSTPITNLYRGHKVIRFSNLDQQARSTIESFLGRADLSLDLWSENVGYSADISMSPKDLAAVKGPLLDVLDHSVYIEDVGSLMNREEIHSASHSALLESLLRNGKSTIDETEFFNDYQSYDTITKFWDGVATRKNSGVKRIVIGKTFLDRNIFGYKFGHGKQNIIFHGGIHAREWIGPATASYIGLALATGSEYKDLRSQFTFFVIPVLNVDGYEYSRTPGHRMHRKNMQAKGNCLGTDANRNFGYHWNQGGASGRLCAQDYHGPFEFSTPESKAIADFISSKGAISYIDIHSYSQLLMSPYGYSCKAVSPYAHELEEAGRIAADVLKQHGTYYRHGPICETIYQASGNSVDWAADVGKVKYAFTIELRDRGNHGFLLPAEQIVPTGKETLDAVASMWRYVAQDKEI